MEPVTLHPRQQVDDRLDDCVLHSPRPVGLEPSKQRECNLIKVDDAGNEGRHQPRFPLGTRALEQHQGQRGGNPRTKHG